MNNYVFGKTVENVRKHRIIKLVTTVKRRNYIESKANYHSTKFFTDNLLTVKVSKNEIFMNKAVYFSLSILELCKIVIHQF